ncbi:MAG: tetratricopeptide repeat protein [Ktedonobacterales bacterium]
MVREKRRGQHRHEARRTTSEREREASAQLSAEQQAQIAAQLGALGTLAETLREAQAAGREALVAKLDPVRALPNDVALTFAQRLGDQRGSTARDAADVAQAIGELDMRKEVAREARRARIRLRSIGALPSLVIPLPAAPASTVITPPTISTRAQAPDISVQTGPIFAEGFATRTREQGEIALLVGWQEGQDPNFLRGQLLQLSFWREGVEHFEQLDTMSRRRFHSEVVDGLRGESERELVPITRAQARRLILEALAVNEWRSTQPDAGFQQYRAQMTQRLFSEPEDEVGKLAIAEEERRSAREGDVFLVGRDLEPDETVANWIGAWSFGDYALAYDLLAVDHPLRQRQTRDEFIALRRRWAEEAKADGLRLTLIREQEQRASVLWVPTAPTALGGEREDIEAFWSLLLHESPLGGQLDELPFATLTSKENGRHWYWTGYTLARDHTFGVWRISRNRDEGAASQALTVEELQRRIKEAHETVERITQAPPPQPRSEEANEALRAVTGALTSSLHYSDALTARLPLDESNYQAAVTDARSLNNHERAAALLEKMQGRFADDVHIHFELGAEQYLVSTQYESQGQTEAATAWLERAIATLTSVAEAQPTAEHIQGVAELLARQGHYNQAEERLREAIRIEPERASLYSDLADSLVGRITGENLDDGSPVMEDERRRVAQDALGALREASRLDASIPGLFTRMGAIYDLLKQPDDALIALEEGIRRDPGDAEAQYALGSLLLSREQPQRALAPLETAVQLSPLTITYRLSLAAAYGALERYAEATRELDLIDRLQPGLPQVAELRSILARQRKKG